MSLNRLAPALVAALCLAPGVPATAGQRCQAQRLTPQEIAQAMDLGMRSAIALDASGAQVALIARAGQDLRAHGLHWSHLGFVYRDPVQRAWRILHKLNECGSDQGQLYRQGLADFFLERPWRHEAAIVVLDEALQQALLPVLRDNERSARLHHARYSMVAHPYATRYQQSNQWALETLAAAASPRIAHREAAQRWLREQGFRPTRLQVPAYRRLGARLATAHIAFDDHPSADRFAGRIDTVTVDAVFDFLRERGLGRAPHVVR